MLHSGGGLCHALRPSCGLRGAVWSLFGLVGNAKQFLGAVPQDVAELVLLVFSSVLAHLVHNNMLQHELLLALLHHPLLNGCACHKPVDHHRLLLPQPMGPRLGLQIVVGVPVGVKDNDGVCSGEVDAQAAGPGGEKEAEVAIPLFVEAVYPQLAGGAADRAVDAAVASPAGAGQPVLQDVKHAGELAVDQHPVPGSLQPRHHPGKQRQLAACRRQLLVDLLLAVAPQGGTLCSLKEVGVVAALPQLHDDVLELGRDLPSGLPAAHQYRVALCQHRLVVLLLLVAQLHSHHLLLLGRHLLQDILLQAAQQVWLQEGVQPCHLLLGGNLRELRLEVLEGGELPGLQEMHEHEQLVEVVLKWGAGQQCSLACVEAVEDLEEP
mmetsp:Transcript_32611/g.92452  ORF Transcript_32611/g.92452 Transcript_32611/m.92452 type:complete len:380 (-) Transcript_32611:1553-2692(-)